MKYLQKYLSACLLGAVALVVGASSTWAQTAPNLGAASTFGALGGAGVTCTSPSPALPAITVTGDVGAGLLVSTAVTGFPPTGTLCSLSGTVQGTETTPNTVVPYGDFLAAYNKLASNLPADGYVCPSDAAHSLSGDISDTATRPNLSPGVYCLSGVVTLTGQLTLNGPSTGVWIFKSDPASGASIAPINGSVVMAGGGQSCNVYWQLSTTAVFDGRTAFVGTVLAGSAISFTGVGSSLAGRALAQTLVSMTGANISACTGGVTPPASCDKDHRHHKHCGHNKNDKPHCDGHQDGHGQWHDSDDDDNGNGSEHDSPFDRGEHGHTGGNK